MRLTRQEVARITQGMKVKRLETTREKRVRKMNRTELNYADLLARLQISKLITVYRYESIKLRLAEDTTLTPDFEVVYPDGHIEFHEVKGGFIREDSWVKLKIAAELYPEFIFYLCQYKNKIWSTKRV